MKRSDWFRPVIAAAFAAAILLQPLGAAAINPQPEPPGAAKTIKAKPADSQVLPLAAKEKTPTVAAQKPEPQTQQPAAATPQSQQSQAPK